MVPASHQSLSNGAFPCQCKQGFTAATQLFGPAAKGEVLERFKSQIQSPKSVNQKITISNYGGTAPGNEGLDLVDPMTFFHWGEWGEEHDLTVLYILTGAKCQGDD